VRTWATHYRGLVLITSSARPADTVDAKRFPAVTSERLGVAVCIVDLVDVRPANASDYYQCGEFDPSGQVAWVMREPVAVEPIRVKGALGLRAVPPELVRELLRVSSPKARELLTRSAA
jgi:hypothetical protein